MAKLITRSVGLLVMLALMAPKWASADDAADFYKGKQINWILSAGVGGGFAAYAQIFQQYYSRHIPGRPSLIIQNMTGAGGIRAMNYLYSVAPKDGTTIGLVHSSVPFAPLFGIKGAAFDPRNMNWIGSMNTESVLCIAWHDSPIKSWQDLKDKEFIVGSTGMGNQMATIPAMLNKLFNTKIKIIAGYKNGTDVYLAMERGEVMGRCSGGQISSVNESHPDWFSEHKVNVPILVTQERSPLFPNTPSVVEFAKDTHTQQLLRIMFAPQYMGRPLLTPPGVPAERVAVLRKAFHDAMNDPAFKADAKRQNIEIDEVGGEKLHQVLEETYKLPPEIVKAANEAMNLSGSEASD